MFNPSQTWVSQNNTERTFQDMTLDHFLLIRVITQNRQVDVKIGLFISSLTSAIVAPKHFPEIGANFISVVFHLNS